MEQGQQSFHSQQQQQQQQQLQVGNCYRNEVPHIPQRFSWDCGLACVLMALRATGVGWQRARYKDMLRLCPTTSVWTIDLAHLLARFDVGVSFSTVTIGADHSYANEAFYAPQWGADAARVQRLFDSAGAAGVGVALESVPLERLRRLVGGGTHLAIVLVDKRITDPAYCCGGLCCGYEGPHEGDGGGAAAEAEGGGGAGAALGGAPCGHWWQEQQLRKRQQQEQPDRWERRLQDAEGDDSDDAWEPQQHPEEPPEGKAAAGVVGCGAAASGVIEPASSRGAAAQLAPPGARAAAEFHSGGSLTFDGGLPAIDGCGAPGPEVKSGGAQRQRAPLRRTSQDGKREREEAERRPAGPRPEQHSQEPRQQQPAAAAAAAAAAGAGPSDANHGGYAGHYLLLVNCDVDSRLFWVQDPAKPSGPSPLCEAALEAGRRAFGTDEDLLLIELPKGPP